ncbi:hypothetical protein [Kribbella sp. NPDC051718]|uniref:hypothetical protein n=1 Tax=Kribbella sp. NPDC051718 TaxID=3155168 RepID=UPI00343027E9
MTAVEYGSGVLGALGAHTTTGDMATADVGLFGDSIAQRGTPELTNWLAGLGKTLATDNQGGCTTENALDRTANYPTLPQVIIMATGANDIFQPPLLTDQLSMALALFAGHDLMWVDVQVCRPGTVTRQIADQRNTGYVNGFIRDAITPDRVAGWSRTFAKAPARLGMYLETDGVHPRVGPQPQPYGDGTAHWRAIVMGVLGGLL